MDGQNQLFVTNPLTYCRSTVVNIQTKSGDQGTAFNSNKIHQNVYVDLVPWKRSGWFSRAVGMGDTRFDQVVFSPQTASAPSEGSDALIAGFYAPYREEGEFTSGVKGGSKVVVADVAVEVDQNNPTHNFIFTGGQNGCSLLLLDTGVAGKYTAMHYPNSTGKANGYPLLPRGYQVVLESYFALYGEKFHPNAFSFFYYDTNQWTLIYQPQSQAAATDEERREHKRNKMSIRSAALANQVQISGAATYTLA